MSPDRRLTKTEMRDFIIETRKGKVKFSALTTIMKEGTEPTLHDLCITELIALTSGQQLLLIDQGANIEVLIKRVEDLEEKLKRLE